MNIIEHILTKTIVIKRAEQSRLGASWYIVQASHSRRLGIPQELE